ncbi:MAG: type II secretion system protein GspE [candidate division Zixibacteria bacterium SM23_73]|nr:MAG: type II secretion system protein GspE [candidate division Zixibacteria bacterium SM23_73]
MASNLGDLLKREKLLTDEQLRSALDFQKKNGVPMGSALTAMGFISESEMAQALSRQLGYPYVDLDQFEVYPDVIKLIPREIAQKYMIMPIHRIRSFLTLAMVDPTDLAALEDVKFRTGLSIQPVITSESSIKNALNKYYGSSYALRLKKQLEEVELAEDASVKIIEEDEEEEEEVDDLAISEEEAPVISLVNQILIEAIKKMASDVHLEPYESSVRVRYRMDGILYEVMNISKKFKNAVLSRLKIMANMDIAEKRLPQDGRIKMSVKKDDGGKKKVDMRVSSVPAMWGEKIVVRILDQEMLKLDLTQLGFEKESLKIFKGAIEQPWGIILVTGPTGSGKTNTLYSAISNLNSLEKNIMTAEDPIEFHLSGINQVNVKEEIGLTFPNCLRSFLRQDPDIMLVGEMRDFETCDIAIKASLTGHLVFSTLHTNDAASAIGRLVNMNVEPFLIANSIILVVAQRLVRRLCKKCRAKQDVPISSLVDMGFAEEEAKNVTVYKPKGCVQCNNTGYKGRVGLFEVMKISDEIRDLVLKKAHSREIKNKAVEQGMMTLRQSGLVKIKNGLSSMEDVLGETIKD